MKKYKSLLAIIAVVCALVFSSAIQAQEKPSWIPDNGFWIVVTNKHIKKHAIVQFYDNNDQLIYEDRITGKNFSLRKKKNLLFLKKCLDNALASSTSNNFFTEKRNWIIPELNKKQSLKDR